MKKLFKYTLAALTACTIAACSKDTIGNNSQPTVDQGSANGREVIAFSPEGNGVTRAVGDPAGFSSATKVVMRMKAQNGTETEWDDYRYTQAVLTAGTALSDDACNTSWGLSGTHSHLTYVNESSSDPTVNKTRYWDDAFGRNSKITIYALAVPNQTNPSKLGDDILDHDLTNDYINKVNSTTNPNWYTIQTPAASENTKVSWTVHKEQDATTIVQDDLAYSNNIGVDERPANFNELSEEEKTKYNKYKGRYKQTWGGSPADWQKSMDWGRLEWEPQSSGSTVGKFDQGHLLFQHALTYIEINLTEGTGFDNTANTDFNFSNTIGSTGQHMRLIGFPTTGQLDLSKKMNETGMWTFTSPTTGTDDIIKFKETATRNSVSSFKLECLVIPGTNLDGNSNNLLEFEIDNAKYYVTGEQIASAIQGHSSFVDGSEVDQKTMAGKHYVINLTVGKTKITNITAAILPWEDVNTKEIPADNAVCTFTFEDERGEDVTADKFNLYRAQMTSDDNATVEDGDAYITNETDANYNWVTGYQGPATKRYVTNHWETDWYWPNNKIFYHFRAAGLNKSGNVTIETDATKGDYFAIQHGSLNGGSYEDWIWGAPFKYVNNTYKIKYTSTNGFDENADGSSTKQLSPAIAATHSNINMLLFHMTSQITVNLTTTTGADAVTLKSGATNTEVKIVRFMPKGIVRMGTGKVEAIDKDDDDSYHRNTAGVAMTVNVSGHSDKAGGEPEKFNNYTYGMVPQPLSYSGGTVGLEITTPDGNVYYVRDLSTITAQINANPESLQQTHLANPYTQVGSTGYYTINEWFPHYKYVYNIKLTKKGIDKITAAILPWEVVEGTNIDVDLEK